MSDLKKSENDGSIESNPMQSSTVKERNYPKPEDLADGSKTLKERERDDDDRLLKELKYIYRREAERNSAGLTTVSFSFMRKTK